MFVGCSHPPPMPKGAERYYPRRYSYNLNERSVWTGCRSLPDYFLNLFFILSLSSENEAIAMSDKTTKTVSRRMIRTNHPRINASVFISIQFYTYLQGLPMPIPFQSNHDSQSDVQGANHTVHGNRNDEHLANP